MPSLDTPMSAEEIQAAINLKEAIRSSSISQSLIARRLERTQGTVSQWVNAHCRVPPKWAKPLAEMLQMRPEEICPNYHTYVSTNKNTAM